jgi:signal transduction histidine kinase
VLLRAERPAILASYAESLEEPGADAAAAAKSGGRDLAVATGAEIIADVLVSLQGSEGRVEERHTLLSWMADDEQAVRSSSPAELLRATAIFFDITVSALAARVEDDPGLLPCFVTAIRALNESIARRVREATLAHTGQLLEHVDQARIEERRRIARDLHDRLGEGMSAALRQLELHEIAGGSGGGGGNRSAPRPRVAIAKDALTEAMRRLRTVTSDLRQEPIRSLERGLVQYIDSAATGAVVRLRVSGDEAWASPAVIDEAFLIIREAIRNALRHGASPMVLIGVALAPDELHAWVEDDGRGFVPAAATDPLRSGTGLASIRERAALLGGQLTIASAPGQGTRVELSVPLAGRRHE